MKITISDKSAPAEWGVNALLSNTADGFDIHLNASEDRLDKIQQAARKISALGVSEVTLTGSSWDLEGQWSFALGYLKARHGGVIHWVWRSCRRA